MNFNIDLMNKQLIGKNIKLPFKYRGPEEVKFTFSLEPNERKIKQIPVSVYSGEIIVNPRKINDLIITPILSHAKQGFAVIEIVNPSDKRIEVTLNEPLEVDAFNQNVFETYTLDNIVQNINNFNSNKNNNMKYNMEQLIRTDHLNSEEKQAIIKLCNEFSDILYKPGDKLTFTSKIKHEIKLTDETPIYTKSYKYPYVYKEEVRRQINEMLEKGIIRPSSSPWSSPIWIVPKKLDASGTRKFRIVCDLRKINAVTISDKYPIPNINDILDKLGRAQYFSTLDLASGFHQIQMHENSIEKTGFTVENGHYEYVRMPFGLKNAPSTFQRVMDEVLKDLQNKICMVFMDDVIVFSTGLTEHIQNLKLVFKKLREANLKIQLDKCEFLRREVEFLGHVVTPDGIKPNKKKIAAIQKYRIPKTQREIKSFLGLLGYYRKFIKNFAKITKPMTQCLKKDGKVEHTKEFIDCFNTCKNILTSEPVLAYPDFSKPFELTTDASNYAISGILSQGNHPICYASRTLNPAEINYSTIEKELLAIVWSCKYFRPYLFGRKFVIYTDHKPLQYLMSLKEPNSRLVRWKLKLEEFEYEIRYKKGKNNQAADALSRNPTDLCAVETDSVYNNTGDSDEIIKDFLINPEELPNLDDLRIDEFLDKNEINPNQTENRNQQEKINIISDIQIVPPTQPVNPDTDSNTVHSAAENPIFGLPISERPLNMYKNQIFITCGDISDMQVRREKIFENTRNYFTLSNKDPLPHIFKLLKEYINPKQLYAIYFRHENIARVFITTAQKYFQNSSFKMVQCTNILEDLQLSEDQVEKLELYHTTKTCHRGINEMKMALNRRYYWPKLSEDVQNYVNNCEICQKNKYDRAPPVIKFNLTPTASKPFEHIHIDTFRLNNDAYVTVIDSFSRYGQAYPLKSITGVQVVENLFDFVTHHGLPLKITADRGTEFKNKDLEDFCRLYKIELHFTTALNSNSNSPVERFHSSIIESYRCLKEENKDLSTDQLIKRAVLGYNNSIHTVTKFTPFEIISGHVRSTNPFDLNDNAIISSYIQSHKENSNKLYEQIKQRNHERKQAIISKLNENRSDPPTFENQDIAYIKTKHRAKHLPKYKKVNIVGQTTNKLKTDKTTYHKSCAKKPKAKIKNYFQDAPEGTRNRENPISPTPGTSRQTDADV